MVFFLTLLHIVALFLLIRTVWWTSKTYSITLTFHNLPIVGIWVLMLISGILLSLLHPWIYLSIGLPFGMFNLVLDCIEIPGRPNHSLLGKILSALSVVFLWPELVSFSIFCVWHADKIVDEEPKP